MNANGLCLSVCQATGLGGTAVAGHDTEQVETMKPVKDRVIKVTFNADTHASMQWNFRPQQTEIYVRAESSLWCPLPVVRSGNELQPPAKAGAFWPVAGKCVNSTSYLEGFLKIYGRSIVFRRQFWLLKNSERL